MDDMEMNEVIRQRRSELGMSQADLATRVGVDRRQIRRYESGETQPTLSVAKTIATRSRCASEATTWRLSPSRAVRRSTRAATFSAARCGCGTTKS